MTKTKIGEEAQAEEFPYEAGQVYADVKVTEIVPGLERCIYFSYVMRNKDGTPLNETLFDKGGNVKGYKPRFDVKEHSMTLSDFKEFIRTRIQNGFVIL